MASSGSAHRIPGDAIGRATADGARSEESFRGSVRPAPLIHIGYHKTGTTWLQTGLFDDRRAGFVRPWRSSPIRKHLVLPDGYDFDARRAAEAFVPTLREALAAGLVPVVSDERLSGSPHAGGFDGAWIADRLAEVFPEGAVLLVIREQNRAIYSSYQQYVRDGGGAALSRYLRPRHPAEAPQFRFEHWEYDRAIRRYQELFGASRVLVLPFEELVEDSRRFAERIAGFAGLAAPEAPIPGRRYPSLGALTVAVKRHANRLLVRNALSPGAPLYVKDHERRFESIDRLLPGLLSRGLERRWRREIEDAVGARYRASNRRTEELTGIDVARRGYDVAPPRGGLEDL